MPPQRQRTTHNLQNLKKGDRVRVQFKAGFKFDAFESGMEGVVLENRQDCRNFLVLFDGSSVSVIVGYKYLEPIDSDPVVVPDEDVSPTIWPLPKLEGAIANSVIDCNLQSQRRVVAPHSQRVPTQQAIPSHPTSARQPGPMSEEPEPNVPIGQRSSAGPTSPNAKRRIIGSQQKEAGEPHSDLPSRPPSFDAGHSEDAPVKSSLGRRPSEKRLVDLHDHSRTNFSRKPSKSKSQDTYRRSCGPHAPHPTDEDPEQTGVRAEEILKLQLELQQKNTLLQTLENKHFNLQAELNEKDQTIIKQDEELSDAHNQLDLMKTALGARDKEIVKLKERLQIKERKIAELDDEITEIRWSMPLDTDQDNSVEELDNLRKSLDRQKEELGRSREVNRKRAEDVAHLQQVVQESSQQMKRLESAQEKELMDAEYFIKSLAQTSAHPVLRDRFHLQNMSILGRGNYGYITLCKSTSSDKSEEDVVMKWQSERWATVVMKEWAHGSEVGKHPHIVEYIDVFMHADEGDDVKGCLQAGFSSGALQGKQPKIFPDCYFCIAVEYMDRGTVQNLMDQDILTLESIGAITRQISSALAFMHSKARTHNDIKPENVLLRTSRHGKCLLAKLADFGMANHAVDRKRDCELFGYTIWCMGLKQKFVKVPSGNDQAGALQEFQDGVPKRSENQSINEKLWSALHRVISGMWRMTMDMRDVQEVDSFEMLEVKVPASAKKELEEAAKTDLHRRSTLRTSTIQRAITSSCPTLPDVSALVVSSKYDSKGYGGGSSASESDCSKSEGSDFNCATHDRSRNGSNDSNDKAESFSDVRYRPKAKKPANNNLKRTFTTGSMTKEPSSPQKFGSAPLQPPPRRRRHSAANAKIPERPADTEDKADYTQLRSSWPVRDKKRHSVERVRGVLMMKDNAEVDGGPLVDPDTIRQYMIGEEHYIAA